MSVNAKSANAMPMPTNATAPTNSTTYGGGPLNYSQPDLEYKLQQNGQQMAEAAMVEKRMESGAKFTGMRVKFMNYFLYALQGEGTTLGDCINNCGQAGWNSKCCASVSMSQGGQKDLMYACINQSVAMNVNVNLAGMDVGMKCVNSGASALAAGAAAGLVIVSMI